MLENYKLNSSFFFSVSFLLLLHGRKMILWFCSLRVVFVVSSLPHFFLCGLVVFLWRMVWQWLSWKTQRDTINTQNRLNDRKLYQSVLNAKSRVLILNINGTEQLVRDHRVQNVASQASVPALGCTSACCVSRTWTTGLCVCFSV